MTTPKEAAANVAFIRQRTQYTCGAASLCAALKAQGLDVNEDQVNGILGAAPMQGVSWEQVLAASQHFGMRATLVTPSTVAQLKSWTDQGIPVLISWNPEGRKWSHVSVVFDVSEGMVHVMDPNIPNPSKTVRSMSEDEFYGKWYEEWSRYLVRRVAVAIEREITSDGRQVMANDTTRTSRRLGMDLDKALEQLDKIGGDLAPTSDSTHIWQTQINHGYEEPISGGTDVMKRLQDQYLIEQGKAPRGKDGIDLSLEKLNHMAGEAPHTRVRASFEGSVEDEWRKMAGRTPSGLYGYTKAVQASCESAVGKLRKRARKIAIKAFRRNPQVASFLNTHAQRTGSVEPDLLVSALRDTIPAVKQGSIDVTAGSGLYGYSKAVAKLGLRSCTSLRQAAGEVATGLAQRKAALKEKIYGFLGKNHQEASCGYSRMLYASFPDVKVASSKEPQTMQDWLLYEE